MSGSAALEIPCLGKQFQLGMLYDCRNECLNHDRRLWDADILNNALVSLPSPQTQCDVFTNDSFDGKMEMVGGANASFKVSLLSGLADVPSGYVNFFKDRVSSKQQARVILKCERIYRHERLDIDLLRSVLHENGDGEKSATHFVSGILYGANTFFVFDREVKRNESHANVSSDMKLLISSLSSLHEIPEMDKEEAKKLTCTVYGDTPLSGSSISVEQAMKNIGEQRKSHEPVVPIKVFLQPLISVDIEPARFLNEIDVGIISQLQSIIDNFSEIHTRMNILTKTTAFFNFSSIQKKLSKFKEMISQYTNALKKDLSSLLPRGRSGDVEEKELKTVLEERTTTPFCQAYLSSWVDKTEKEVNLLSIYLDYFKGIQFAFEPDELDSVINSLDYDRVVCFSFMIDDFQDKQLQEMYTYLRTGKWNQEPPDESSWCNNQNKRLINDFKTQARRFSKFAKAAEEDNGTKFVVTNISNESKGDKIAVIQMFQDGQPMQFEPDTIPLQALAIDDNAGLSASKTSNVNRRTVFESTKSLRSRDTTVRESAEPDETTQTVQQMSWHFNQGISTKSESDDVRNIRPKLTPSKAYHQNPREVLESRRRDAGTSPSSSLKFQIDEEDVGRNAFAKAGTHLPERETYSSSVHEPEGTKQTMLHGSSYDQVRNKLEEQTKMRTSTSSENDSRKLRTKAQHSEHDQMRKRREERAESRKLRTKHSDALPSSLKSEIEEEDDFGTNSSAKSDGMLPRTSAGDAKTQAVSATCQRLAERMRPKSERIKNGENEFGSIYKLPMEETMRLNGKMIVKKILKNELHGVSSTQERQKEKVLLVMGATGAGKSTLINGMINYIMGVEWEDEFRFKLVTDDSSLSQTKSVTKEITAYTIHPMEGSAIPYVLTIVDTPGFGDTEGMKRDVLITKQIKDFFSLQPPDGIDHLDGIGFVTQSALVRLTQTQKYIFDSILAIFGKDVERNLFMMVTFADGQEPPVLKAINAAQISYESSFKFNSSALFAKNTTEDINKMFWKIGRTSFENFFAKFGKTNCVSLNLTKKVLKEREHLEALVEGINPQIKMGLGKIEELRQEKRILEEHKGNIRDNKGFEYFVPVMKTKKIDLRGTGRHTNICLNCNYTCHNDCKIAEDSEKERCVAMDAGGNCKVCKGKCSWKMHRNFPYLIEYITVNEKRTYENLKQRYNTAVSGKVEAEGILEQLTENLRQLRINVLTNMYEVRLCLHRLDEIALKPDPLSEVKYIELLIETEKQEAREGFMDRVRDLKQVKSKVEILSKVKSVNDIPKLVDELIPVEETKCRTDLTNFKSKVQACVVS